MPICRPFRGWSRGGVTSLLLGVLLCLGSTVHQVDAANPFSSNVVALTPQNWKEVVVESPHAVLVNICRAGWGYCQLLQPEWEALAGKSKGMVTIAYWDTEGGGRPPRLLGDFQGTPTIRLFKPKKKQSNPTSHSDKAVVEYRHGERNVKDLMRFIEDQMTNYVERISFGPEDWKKVQAKAAKFGLPQAVVFTTKPKTTAMLKYLSTQFRRRLLVVQVAPTAKNQPVIEEFGFSVEESKDLPALVLITPSGERIAYNEKEFTRRKLERFLNEHALIESVYKPVFVEKVSENMDQKLDDDAMAEKMESKEETQEPKVHVEL